jgi:cold shock CspA family protein
MSAESFLTARRPGPGRFANHERIDPRGIAKCGRISKMLLGQSHGFIRLHDREIFFHRGDLREGTAFNDLRPGDYVRFELIEDAISGARALRVMRRRAR